ncbi:Efflux pump azaL [Mycena venus]|uniref:Efflux pump azaL n=1 Tax=Mycena venus TaxID=2733690 RepID=A0A8H7CC80_9AGAR|nr:Efflux pump azaL [Mycena venus]
MTNDVNERTSLLPPQAKKAKKPTTLPKLQLAIIMLIQICEPLTSQSIYPYINQLVSELDITGGDKRKVGYYAQVECSEKPALQVSTVSLGVMKSALGDLTHSSNRARAFRFVPLIWATGASLGPFIGGTLSTPADPFPGNFLCKILGRLPILSTLCSRRRFCVFLIYSGSSAL